MEITRQAVEDRRKQLVEQFEKLKSDSTAVFGAIQDCNYWLAQLDKAASAPS